MKLTFSSENKFYDREKSALTKCYRIRSKLSVFLFSLISYVLLKEIVPYKQVKSLKNLTLCYQNIEKKFFQVAPLSGCFHSNRSIRYKEYNLLALSQSKLSFSFFFNSLLLICILLFSLHKIDFIRRLCMSHCNFVSFFIIASLIDLPTLLIWRINFVNLRLLWKIAVLFFDFMILLSCFRFILSISVIDLNMSFLSPDSSGNLAESDVHFQSLFG